MRGRFTCLVFLLSFPLLALAKDDYKLGPDSMKHAGVPRGKVGQFKWASQVFAGTVRDCWLYVPAQYHPREPACVMVFQDGARYVDTKGEFRLPTVFDNLIHKKEIPVMIGIFINPGTFPAPKGQKPRSNRGFEYDTLSDQYARFLEKEILPAVAIRYNLRKDPDGRGICGLSSGGIYVAQDLAEQVRPLPGGREGTFTNLRGGNAYPDLIRKTEPKPIRVFLQDGQNDLKDKFGDWWQANQEMDRALAFAKYDHKLVGGDGGHNGKHGGAILPESLRWLWRGTPAATSEKR